MQTPTTRINDFLAAAKPYLTDGGLETTLIFHYELDLPCFAAFPLIDTHEGRGHLERYYESFVKLALKSRTGFVLDAPTWRASPEWGAELGYGSDDLARVNRESVEFTHFLRNKWETKTTPILVNGVIGPRGDGYISEEAMSRDEAEAFHAPQILALADGGVDLVTAVTMTNAAEAVGIARAAISRDVPVVISFTVETDGCLPSGLALKDAITEVDDATGGSILYFMINCAHPDHYSDKVAGGDAWRLRLGGLRSNASRLSHAELDNAETLDAGDPDEFGRLHQDLTNQLPNIRVLGGCCGTDDRHIRCVAHHNTPSHTNEHRT
ncbi:homocysteine S-methyltransferase family protein [Aliiroseovarius sp. KMU-50]|uniref:Homocysteine S-methyltransferase family protein n=1 Tax=Aliiroseovarius salicola TaxID=3009082 RepID=A0ABT4VZM8_9RHOB|nr:homocysteine S-methyltransferase family protein [Aliiroseovarius sp. KMU-50]MDA5093710.1 homocysteine S-methyltransferase family protein [Aliiroseovarius sp. KMU-50]